jgi:uncharacterized protein involved in outer membrane biogenesis
MKKVLLFLFGLIFLVIVAAAIYFFVFFDANRFRPQIIEQIETRLGQPAELADIRLGWSAGPALKLSRFKIYRDEFKKEEPLLSIEEASTEISWSAILQKRIQVTSFVLKEPIIIIEKNKDGTIKGLEKVMKEAQQAQSEIETKTSGSEASSSAAPMAFLVDSLKIEDGHILYKDQTLGIPVPIEIKDLDLEINDLSLISPIDFNAKLSVLSEEQNIELQGNVRLLMEQETIVLKKFQFLTNLSKLDLVSLSQLLPEVPAESLPLSLKGLLSASVDELKIVSGNPTNLNAKINFKEGEILHSSLAAPIKNIFAELIGGQEKIDIRDVKADFAGGKLALTGTVLELSKDPIVNLDLSVAQVSMENALTQPKSPAPYPSGLLSFNFHGSMNTKNVEKTLTGSGQLSIQEAKIHRLNVLKEVFNQLSIIPGLVQKLESRLPENYKDKVSADYTVVQKLEVPLKVRQGNIEIQNLEINADSFLASGQVNVSLDKNIDANMILKTDKGLTEALTRSVEELKYVTNKEGQLELPFTLKGVLPNVRPSVNVNFLASKLASSKAQDLIGGFLNNQLSPKGTTNTPIEQQPAGSEQAVTEGAVQATASSTQQPKDSSEQLEEAVGQLMQGFLSGKKTS